jgi:amino acid transporter
MTQGQSAVALNASSERPSSTFSGYLMLLVLLVLIAFGIYQFTVMTGSPEPAGGAILGFAGSIFLLCFLLIGFYMLQPNQAAAITLFGDYRGTDRNTGLRWTWP